MYMHGATGCSKGPNVSRTSQNTEAALTDTVRLLVGYKLVRVILFLPLPERVTTLVV